MQRARCYLLGERTVVLELEPPLSLASQQRIWALAEHLNQHDAVREVIPGMNNLTVVLMDAHSDARDAIDQLLSWWETSEPLPQASRLVEIPVVYGGEQGPDLDVVAAYCGMTPRQTVECHAAGRYIVYFLGFQPGFPYLGGLDERLYAPRRAEPRVLVPAGSVGIGGQQTGIYPLTTPGGWQLIGRTALTLFNPSQTPPTLLHPGDQIRFVPQREGVC
ncbi:5-oxoprolinase subunit PxpB [Musicola paradisiaca]|uniref:Allophanate hydrolase subunit 1 n=1 Tax=Musicola paradisiaca (strain Ech703) TaxID=579405 RepID=C6CCD0_MUSP7|nr:5-oxoprolinase subunit PxpB [Musicola paradisiaca]ACS84941.1 Allophanate hydrolase subunit 1 [Musicola paradisiaca Ech703]